MSLIRKKSRENKTYSPLQKLCAESPEVLSEHLTHLELTQMDRITPDEIVQMVMAREQGGITLSNVNHYISFSNRLSLLGKCSQYPGKQHLVHLSLTGCSISLLMSSHFGFNPRSYHKTNCHRTLETKLVTYKSGIWDFVEFKIVGQGVPHRIFHGYGFGMLSIGKF